MLTKLLHFVTVTGILTAAFLTLTAILAPVYPPAELLNHFRPFIILGCIALLLFSVILSRRGTTYLASAVIISNLLLMLPAINYISPSIKQLRGERIKLLTFNAHITNTDLDKARSYILNEKPDIVVFQEFGFRQEHLLEQLKSEYPYQVSCARNISCFLVLISKRPFTDSYTRNSTAISPPIVAADFKDKNGRKFKVIGTHISWPFKPYQQEMDMNWLAEYSKKDNTPIVILGDFNHTPWSWRLTKFASKSGLRRHATLLRSWPANMFFPIFLIDHVFSSKEISNIGISTGPDLNSDHLPVLATITLK